MEFFRQKFAGSQADRIVKAEAEAKQITEQLKKAKVSGYNLKDEFDLMSLLNVDALFIYSMFYYYLQKPLRIACLYLLHYALCGTFIIAAAIFQIHSSETYVSVAPTPTHIIHIMITPVTLF